MRLDKWEKKLADAKKWRDHYAYYCGERIGAIKSCSDWAREVTRIADKIEALTGNRPDTSGEPRPLDRKMEYAS